MCLLVNAAYTKAGNDVCLHGSAEPAYVQHKPALGFSGCLAPLLAPLVQTSNATSLNASTRKELISWRGSCSFCPAEAGIGHLLVLRQQVKLVPAPQFTGCGSLQFADSCI